MFQSTLRYNMPQIISSEALKLAVGVSPVSTIDKCTMAEISPCISYVTPDKYINMAVLEVTLPSGYKADRTSLHNLVKSSESSKLIHHYVNLCKIHATLNIICFRM